MAVMALGVLAVGAIVVVWLVARECRRVDRAWREAAEAWGRAEAAWTRSAESWERASVTWAEVARLRAARRPRQPRR